MEEGVKREEGSPRNPLWPKDIPGRMMALLGVLCCLHPFELMGVIDTYRLPLSSSLRFDQTDAHLLLLLAFLEGLLGLSMILRRQWTALLSWVVVPAWILSLGWWALLFPRASVLMLKGHDYLAYGWWTFALGSSWFLFVFTIIHLRKNAANHTV